MNDNLDELRLRVRSKSGKSDEDEKLLKPLLYVMEAPEFYIFVDILRCFNYWYKVSPEILEMVEDIIAIITYSYTLEDDVMDNSTVRLSRPAAHVLYGTTLTTISAVYGYCIALEKARSLENPQAFDIVLETIMNIHRTQGMEIYSTEYLHCPSEEEYFEENKRKGSSVILPAANLMKLLSESTMDLSKFSYGLVDYLQLCNDYACLWSERYQHTKGIPYEDITEGKFNYPVAYAVKNSPKKEEILQILKQRTTDMELKKHCIKLIEECGGRSYTLAKMNEAYDNIVREIEALGGNPKLEELLEKRLKLMEV